MLPAWRINFFIATRYIFKPARNIVDRPTMRQKPKSQLGHCFTLKLLIQLSAKNLIRLQMNKNKNKDSLCTANIIQNQLSRSVTIFTMQQCKTALAVDRQPYDDVTWPWKVKVMTPICFVPIISEMAGDSDLVTMERLLKMASWKSNGHATDDVMWPWNVKVVTPIHLDANVSKTAGDTGFVPLDHQ